MSNPAISVLMTVYNTERFVKEAVESILNQTFRDFEFIIVDNCSTDRSVKIIESFKDPRIILIRNNQNLGQTKALNIGLAAAQGELIARMDADDVAVPERLEVQYKYLKEQPQMDVVGSFCMDINEEGKDLRLFKVPSNPLEIKCCLAVSGDLSSWCISHPTVMMRREVVEKVGRYNDRVAAYGFPQDYDLWNRMVMQGATFANIPQVLLKYRILQKSESRNPENKLLEYRLDVSKAKIRHYMPDLTESACQSLAEMLEFQKQSSRTEGEDVLRRFDQFFNLFIGTQNQSRYTDLFKSRLKLYYLPLFATTHAGQGFQEFWKILWMFPSVFFYKQLYRKWAKTFLSMFCTPAQYQRLTNQVLKYR
jgi:glycosyltransferase involved in cell wall biosynthesis